MKQAEIIKHIATAAHKASVVVVSEIGSQTMWLHSVADHPTNLYLSGPMGMAPSVALGVALANPKKTVVAICGDGSLAMNFGALTTIAHQAPKNLIIAVMDNGTYELTGNVCSPSQAVNWEKLTAGFEGFSYTSVNLDTSFDFTAKNGPQLWHAKIEASDSKAPSFPLQPIAIHAQFKKEFTR